MSLTYFLTISASVLPEPKGELRLQSSLSIEHDRDGEEEDPVAEYPEMSMAQT